MAHIPPPSTAVTTSSESSKRIRPMHASNSESIVRISPHAASPTSQSQFQSSLKTLGPNSGPVNSDRGRVDGSNYEESRKAFDVKNSGVEYCEPEKIIGVAGSGNGKRKIMRKTVRLVKKVIKRRVPKRVLASCSENPVKAEDLSKVRDNLDLANDVIERSNVVDEVVEKTSVVNEVNDELRMADDVSETSNLVNEKSDHVDRVTEKTSIIDEVVEKENITYEVMQELEIGNATHVSSEKMVPVIDLSGINTMETDNIESNDSVCEADGNDLTSCAPDLMEVEKVNIVSETSMKTKEIENSKTENQLDDFIAETEKVDIVNMVDSDRIRLTEGLLLSGEMEALQHRKRPKTEIFVGGLNRDAQEDDIRKVFGEAGVIEEIRLVMSNSGKNRGYAFVRFATAADAKNALAKYSKVEICGKQCNIAPVEGNDTIFLSNIDKNWKAKDVVTNLEKAGIEKIDKVTLKADANNIEKNRGFAFVEFQTCKDAQTAFNKLQKKDVLGKEHTVKAAWAQPLSEPAEEEILQVKSVYAEYLPSSWDKERVKDYFKRFGEIESVALSKDLASSRRKDYAFINYTTRDAALACIEAVNRERLEDGYSKVKMAVCLAKPVSKRKQTNSKRLFEANQKAFETSKKHHKARNQGKAARSSYNHVMVDKRSSTTNELVQILRQQASNTHILSHPTTGIDIQDHHFPLPGSKRTFSGHDPLYSRRRVESSYPISAPSSSSHGVGMLSFPYHHRQVAGFTSESVNERRTYPSHFQKREDVPYYADNNMHRRSFFGKGETRNSSTRTVGPSARWVMNRGMYLNSRYLWERANSFKKNCWR